MTLSEVSSTKYTLTGQSAFSAGHRRSHRAAHGGSGVSHPGVPCTWVVPGSAPHRPYLRAGPCCPLCLPQDRRPRGCTWAVVVSLRDVWCDDFLLLGVQGPQEAPEQESGAGASEHLGSTHEPCALQQGRAQPLHTVEAPLGSQFPYPPQDGEGGTHSRSASTWAQGPWVGATNIWWVQRL